MGKKSSTIGHFEKYIATENCKAPEVLVLLVASHRERRTRTDRNGNKKTYYVTVVTWTGRRVFEFNHAKFFEKKSI